MVSAADVPDNNQPGRLSFFNDQYMRLYSLLHFATVRNRDLVTACSVRVNEHG